MKSFHQYLTKKINRWHFYFLAVAAVLVCAYSIGSEWRPFVSEGNSFFGFKSAKVAEAQGAQVGADGRTFAGRKSYYLSTLTGMKDPANLTPTATLTSLSDKAILDNRANFLFGWLEKCLVDPSWSGKCKISGGVVEQTIRYFVGGAFWIDPGPKAQRGFAVIIPLRYKDVITTIAYNAVLERFSKNQIGQHDVYTVENENKLIMSAVGLYLYTEYFAPQATLSLYGCSSQCQKSWPQFTDRNGTTYTNGMSGIFNANSLMKEFLINFIDEWMLANKGIKGQGEFDALTYHRLYPEAMMILATYAKDPAMKNRGKMAADLMILDALMDFSANSWGGVLGRTDYSKMSSTPRFPFRVLFGLSSEESEWDIPAVYSIGYEPSDLLVLLSRFDESWRFHKEYNQGLHGPEKGKWNYLTPNYNMGANIESNNGSSWQANVKGTGSEQFIRFFINANQTEPRLTQEGNYLGQKGYQLRNAMFVSLPSAAKLWEFPSGGASWQNVSVEVGKPGNTWTFKQLGNAYVAIQLKGNQAAVELGDASDGYGSFAAFKTAVKANADLTTSSFTTSKNQKITILDNCGLHSPGDCGKISSFTKFDRMETEYGQGTSTTTGKLIDWQITPNGHLMTVKKGGLTCNYLFSSWTTNGNGCGTTGGYVPPLGGVTNPPVAEQRPSIPVLSYCGLSSASCGSIAGGAPVCGNGIKEGTEQCDGAQLGGAVCSAGTTGSPLCTGSCTLSYNSCVSTTPLPKVGTGGWNHTYPRLAYQHFRDSPPDWNALFDLVIITRPYAETAIAAKAINPDAKFLFTRSLTTYGANQKQKRVTDCPGWNNQWFVRDSKGALVPPSGKTSTQAVLLNITNLAPVIGGQRLNQFLPKCFNTWMREAGFDGVGSDWVWTKPRVDVQDIDFNNNGINDYSEFGGAQGVEAKWMEGLQTFISNWRSDLGPTVPLWLNSGGIHTNTDIPNVMSLSNGLEFERQPGHRNFSSELRDYLAWTNSGLKPSVWITDTYPQAGDRTWSEKRGGHTKNYFEEMRMMLAFTLMGDGYFQYNPREGGEHHFYSYFDEFDLKRARPGYPRGLLGEPSGGAVTLSNNVAVRFFQGGVAIENPNSFQVKVCDSGADRNSCSPSGSIPVVDIRGATGYAGPYYRFRGNQDPTFNNGQLFTSVTLSGHVVGSYSVGDGIILVREPDLAKRTVVSDIIVDNLNDFTSPGSEGAVFSGTGWTNILTNWSAWTHDNDGRSRFTYAFKYMKGGTGTAFYHPTVNVPGQYEVYEWHSDLTKTGIDVDDPISDGNPGTPASAVPYLITYNGTNTISKTVNQSVNPGRWNLLGTYAFTGGGKEGVTISANQIPGVVQADAVMFRYKGQ